MVSKSFWFSLQEKVEFDTGIYFICSFFFFIYFKT